MGNNIQDVPVLMVEAIAISQALINVVVRNMNMVESDSQLIIKSIEGQTDIFSLIINHVADIKNLVKNFNNIEFSYCTRIHNNLVDTIAKRLVLVLLLSIYGFSFPKKRKKKTTNVAVDGYKRTNHIGFGLLHC